MLKLKEQIKGTGMKIVIRKTVQSVKNHYNHSQNI